MKSAHLYILASIICLATAFGCGKNGGASQSPTAGDTLVYEVGVLPDTLRIVTLYGPSSYFLYREQQMGYDYELAKRFATDKGMQLDIVVAPNLSRAVELLDSGKVHLIAYEVPVTAEYLEHLVPCGVENITHQVLVQPKSSDSLITDVTELVGREVYVEKNSRYYHRMINLNAELGGGMKIKTVDRDTLVASDLLGMVADGTVPLTVVDSDVASAGRTYYKGLDISVEVSFPQKSAWAVSPKMRWLGDTITIWSREEAPRKQQAALLRRYYEKSKDKPAMQELDFSTGKMSAYDHIFKKYAAQIGWDWRLLSSMGYAESHYDSSRVSWAGARGIMQLMPATARAYDTNPDDLTDNDICVATSIKVIQSLEKIFNPLVNDPVERKKFVIAAYNSGPAHILDARAIARKYGLNDQVWDDNVADALMMKSQPEVYNDPDVKYGAFRGKQTLDYVVTVMACYNKASKQIPL